MAKPYNKTQGRKALQAIFDKAIKLAQSDYASMRDIVELEKFLKKVEKRLK
jgi:hypothetical protein